MYVDLIFLYMYVDLIVFLVFLYSLNVMSWNFSKKGNKSLHKSIKTHVLKLCLWNAQSLRQKAELVQELRDDYQLDACLFVETWLKHSDAYHIGQLENGGECQFLHNPRYGRTGGGVGCLVRSGLKAKMIESFETKTFEYMETEITLNGKKLSMFVIYRPEPSKQHKYNMNEFFDEFTQLLAHCQTYSNEILIAGDFNFHMNKAEDNRASKLKQILEMFDMVQHVSSPTHKGGNTLDLVITREKSPLISCTVGDLLSDHNCIMIDLEWKTNSAPIKKITSRKTRSIDISSFKNDLRNHLSQVPNWEDSISLLDKLVTIYSGTVEVLNQHAPEKTMLVRLRKPNPWTNSDIKSLKIAKRKAEKKWRTTKLEVDWEIFKEKRNELNLKLKKLKAQDLQNKIESTSGNSKAMFKLINASLNRKQELPLPNHSSSKDLANKFNQYFDSKIKNIREKFNNTSRPQTSNGTYCGPKLQNFEKLSQNNIRNLIKVMPVKHCRLDPLPTWLLLECIDEFLPIMTNIVNLSLKLGVMPTDLKHALVKPLLKKHGLDQVEKNYRPVSNLSFLGKLIESAVIKQFITHLSENKLEDKRQSAYKKSHSTETLLTKVHNDIMLSQSKNEMTLLVLLDLSAAFDTIDHDILIDRLKCTQGIDGTALKWFKSYLSQRSQSVLIGNEESDKLPLAFGVPQGSKLGPLLFNSYIAPVSEIAKKNNVTDEKYADDQQLILSFKPSPTDQRNAVTKMEKCISDIRKFLHDNKLCNNGEKTELLIIGSSNLLKKLQVTSINIDNTVINSAEHVRNLGVIFDAKMTMQKQVNRMCRNVYLNLKNISNIRNSLDIQKCKTVVNALVTPHLDYGNGLLYGISKKLESKLQVAQNSAVRLIKKVPKRDHITAHRKDLHWLPISARVEYKLLLTTWRALNNQAPSYIKNLISEKETNDIGLRSNNQRLLKVPRSVGSNIENRAYSFAAPELWNNLPDYVRDSQSLHCFKKNLKTHLFTKYYEQN